MIGDNNVICAGSVIVGKIKIGNNCVIGANSFINFDIEDNMLVISNGSICKKKKIENEYYYR